MVPASIRTNNPGAQWFGPIASAYGATGTEGLSDGNNAAIFPDPVAGAAAQFALLSKKYAGMPLSAAISKWSGGNSSPQYVNFLTKNTGLSPDTVLTPDLLSSPQGLALAKAQAHWEAGRPYPMSDADWQAAQSRAFNGQTTAAPMRVAMNQTQPKPQGSRTMADYDQAPSLSARFMAGGPGALFGQPQDGWNLGSALQNAGAGLIAINNPAGGAALQNAANVPLMRQRYTVVKDSLGRQHVFDIHKGIFVDPASAGMASGVGSVGASAPGTAPAGALGVSEEIAQSPVALEQRAKNEQDTTSKTLEDMRSRSEAAKRLQDRANEMLKYLDDPNVSTGGFGESKQALKNAVMGVTGYDLGGTEQGAAFEKGAKQLQGEYLQGQKGVRFAGPEISFADTAMPTLNKPRETNRQLLQDLIRNAQLDRDAYNIGLSHYNKYGVLGNAFRQELNQHFGRTPAAEADAVKPSVDRSKRPPLSSFNQ